MSVGEAMADARGPREVSERERHMRARNRALAAVLFALVVLFFLVAIVRMSGG
jgi:uncharacterized protein (DUF2336 family)